MTASVHRSAPARNYAFIDYLSFTWAPEQLASLRKLARANHMTLAQWFKADRESDTNQIDINRLDALCVDELRRFLVACSRDFFQNCEFTTEDAWHEVFSVCERPGGIFGYRKSFDLYFSGQHIGIAAAGAKNGGCYMSLTGAGCVLLDREGMFKSLQALPCVKLTRLDIALDLHDGEIGVNEARAMYKRGQFCNGGSMPDYQYIEGGKLDRRGKMRPCKGRSFYVGSRSSGKLLRVYEKGKQLGDQLSKWVRWEVEIRSSDREIPLFALQRPAEYFAGAYPALGFIAQYDRVKSARRIETRKKQVRATYQHLLKHAQIAYGALVNVMKDRGLNSDEIVETLVRSDRIPQSLKRAAGYVPRRFETMPQGDYYVPDIDTGSMAQLSSITALNKEHERRAMSCQTH